MIKRTCDKCGTELNHEHTFYQVSIYSTSGGSVKTDLHLRDYDLCIVCLDKVEDNIK